MGMTWTVLVSTRHTGKCYEGLYGTEAEAFVAARKLRDEFRGCGVSFSAALLPAGSDGNGVVGMDVIYGANEIHLRDGTGTVRQYNTSFKE